jgi:hypothetical protein
MSSIKGGSGTEVRRSLQLCPFLPLSLSLARSLARSRSLSLTRSYRKTTPLPLNQTVDQRSEKVEKGKWKEKKRLSSPLRESKKRKNVLLRFEKTKL